MEELCDIKLANQPRQKSIPLVDLIDQFEPPLSKIQQFKFLSKTPNSHYDRYMLAKRELSTKRYASIQTHLMHNPNNTDTRNTHAPTSFRQRILYFMHVAMTKRTNYVIRSIKQRISNQPMRQRKPLETPKDQRKRAKGRSEKTVSPGLVVSPETVANEFKRGRGYQLFKEQMLNTGTLLVRNMSEVGGRLIMNACETRSGNIQHDKFVNLTFVKTPGDKIEIECNCPDFKHTAGEGGHELDPENEWMTDVTRCMHIRLLFEFFEDSIKQIPNVSMDDTEGHLHHLLKQMKRSCFTAANSEVAVVSHINYLILHVTEKPGDLGVFVKIHPLTHDTVSSCKCVKNNVKGKPDYFLIKREVLEKMVCHHIMNAIKETNVIHKFLRKKRPPKKTSEKCETFSKEQGKWVSASLLKHKPKQKGDLEYQT